MGPVSLVRALVWALFPVCFAAVPALATPPTTAPYNLDEFFRNPPSSASGHYDQARAALQALHALSGTAQDTAVRTTTVAIVGILPSGIRQQLGGDDSARQAFLSGLVNDPAKLPAAAVLLASTRNDAIRKRLFAKYEREKAANPSLTFPQFLSRIASTPALVRQIIAPPTGSHDHSPDSVHGPGGRGSGGRPPPSGSRATFSLRDLYGSGFDLGGRRLALNIVFNPATRSQELVLNDITNNGNIRGRNVPLADLQHGAVTVVLNGGADQSNAPTFQVRRDGDNIVVRGAEGGERTIALRELFAERARRVRTDGIVRIGGREYYVGGEGHSGMGWVTYWPKDLIDDLNARLADSNFNFQRELVPAAAAPAAEREGNAFKPYDSGFIQLGPDGKYWYQRWKNGAMVVESSDTAPNERETGIIRRPPAGENIPWDQPPADGKISPEGNRSQLLGWYEKIPLGDAGTLDAADDVNRRLDPSALVNARVYKNPQGKYFLIFRNRQDNRPDLTTMREIKNPEVLYDGRTAVLLVSRDGDEVTYYNLRRPYTLNATNGRWGVIEGVVNTRDKTASGNGQITNMTVLEDALKRLGFDAPANVTGPERTQALLILEAAQRRTGGAPFQAQVGKTKDDDPTRVYLQLASELNGGRAYELWPQDREITLPAGDGEGGYGLRGLAFDSAAFDTSIPDAQRSPYLGREASGRIRVEGVEPSTTTLLSGDRVSYPGGGEAERRIAIYVATGTIGTGRDRRSVAQWVVLAVASTTRPNENFALKPLVLFSDDTHSSSAYPLIPSGVRVNLVPLSVPSSQNLSPDSRRQWVWQRVRDGNAFLSERGVLALYDGEPQPQGATTRRNLIGIAAYWGMTRKEAEDRAKSAR